jgi:hypothetical protein
MKVTVIEKAFYGGSMLKPGNTLTVPDDFKASWAVPAGSIAAKNAIPKPAPTQVAVALSQMGKSAPKSFIDVHAKDPGEIDSCNQPPPQPPDPELAPELPAVEVPAPAPEPAPEIAAAAPELVPVKPAAPIKRGNK